MSKIRLIVRGVFLVAAVLLLLDLNRKTDEDTQTVAEFKLKLIEKVMKDSLDTRQKVNLVIDEATEFMDTSGRVRQGIQYLLLLAGLFVVVELVFFIVGRGGMGRA